MTEPTDELPELEAYFVDESAHTAYRLKGVIRIGRAPENTIIITDPTVSRLHAEVWTDNGRTCLRSVGGNGTRVNGAKLTEIHQLAEGDRVDLGWTSFQFTQQELPLGVHAASRGIAGATRRSTADPSEVAHGDTRRETVNVHSRKTPTDPIKTVADLQPIAEKRSRAPMLLLAVASAVAAGAAAWFVLR